MWRAARRARRVRRPSGSRAGRVNGGARRSGSPSRRRTRGGDVIRVGRCATDPRALGGDDEAARRPADATEGDHIASCRHGATVVVGLDIVRSPGAGRGRRAPVRRRRTSDRRCGSADDDGPIADRPGGHEALAHVGVGGDERLDWRDIVGVEHDDGPVARIGERAGEDELAPFVGCAREPRCCGRGKRAAMLQVVVDEVVEQDAVHGGEPCRGRAPRQPTRGCACGRVRCTDACRRPACCVVIGQVGGLCVRVDEHGDAEHADHHADHEPDALPRHERTVERVDGRHRGYWTIDTHLNTQI